MTTQVLVPLKDFVKAKQRLAGVLTPVERRGFVHAMVNDVLTALAALPSAQVIILSDDPSADLLAEHYGMVHWPERELVPGAQGLNAVVKAGLDQLRRDVNQTVMVIHGDLPLISVAELEQLRLAHDGADNSAQITVATDRHRTGSNIVVLSSPGSFEPSYGEDSLAKHLGQHETAQSLFLPGVSRDIDSPVDLFELLEPRWVSAAPHTQTWLRDNGVARRLQTIAASGGFGMNDLTGIASE